MPSLWGYLFKPVLLGLMLYVICFVALVYFLTPI